MPYAMSVAENVIDYSPVIAAFEGRSIQNVLPSISSYQVAQCYEAFTRDLWLYVFIVLTAISITSVWFTRHHGRPLYQILRALFDSVSGCLNQWVGLGFTSMFAVELLYCSGIGLLVLAFENAMHSEMVVKNESHIIDDMDDLIRLKHERPAMFEEGVFTKYFKAGVNKKFRIIWERMRRMGLNGSLYKMEPQDYARSRKLGKVPVFLGSRYMCKINAKLRCTYNRRVNTWMSPSSFGEVPMAFYYSKKTASSHKDYLSVRLLWISQAHLVPHIWEVVTNVFPSDGQDLRCLKEKKDEIYEHLDLLKPIGVKNMTLLLLTTLCALLTALTALVLETFGSCWEKANLQYILRKTRRWRNMDRLF